MRQVYCYLWAYETKVLIASLALWLAALAELIATGYFFAISGPYCKVIDARSKIWTKTLGIGRAEELRGTFSDFISVGVEQERAPDDSCAYFKVVVDAKGPMNDTRLFTSPDIAQSLAVSAKYSQLYGIPNRAFTERSAPVD